MLSFGQRLGLTPNKKPFQIEDAGIELRTKIWNILILEVFNSELDFTRRTAEYPLLVELWVNHYNIPFDDMPVSYETLKKSIRKVIFDSDWLYFFETVEFIVRNYYKNEGLIKFINTSLESENSAYRFVGNSLTPITNENEIKEIEKAINENLYSGVQTHLKQAISLMSDKQNPDFRNSIKESISAVESAAKKITGDSKASLGTALAELKKKKNFHAAYEEAFKKLYGWTSDSDGIRHSLLEESNLTLADARFMLVACSAFVNYMIDISK